MKKEKILIMGFRFRSFLLLWENKLRNKLL